jgi:hypothetical protein
MQPKDKDIFENIPNIVVASCGAEFDANVWAKDFCQRLQHLQSESRAVLRTSSPFIGALVGGTIEELGDEVSIGTVN